MGIVKTAVGYMLLFCLAGPALRAQESETESTVTLNLAPTEIDVGIFYRGTRVRAEATVSECDGAVLVLEAEPEDVTLNRKGREAGIWLNVAQVTISNAPRVYILASSGELDDICSQAVQRDLGLGIRSLRDRMRVNCEKHLVGTEVDEFLKLKTRGGTYNTDIKIKLTPADKGQKLAALLPVPATIPPGIYRVSLYCFKDGELTLRGSSDLTIRRVGVAEMMASLAHKHAAEYGVLAVIVAMVVGIVMGVVFHSLPGSGH
jgi:uncharacterized protein (TIGR02186 family)